MRFRFSLAALVLVITVSALLLGLWARHLQPHRATVEWMAPTSSEADGIRGQSEMSTRGGRHELVFRPRHARINRVFPAYTSGLVPGTDSWSTNDLFQRIELVSSKEATVKAAYNKWGQADVLAPGTTAINGIVEDQRGQPVRYAWVDLLGPDRHIGQCVTRSDGTFTMILDVPPGEGYFLRLRYGDDPYAESEKAHGPKFSLKSQRELVARIRIPKT